MKKLYISLLALLLITTSLMAKTSKSKQSPVERVEPLSWWVGMKTDLQLLVKGDNIGAYNVSVEGNGLSIKKIHKADSPNYLFLDMSVEKAGKYELVFSNGKKTFRYPYSVENRKPDSADRKSFTTSDLIYLIVPDRFANGDESIDSTKSTVEKARRKSPHGRHGGDIQGIIDHLDYIEDLGATAIWSTPLLEDNAKTFSYHGYACSDYYKIDSRFGTNETYRTLVEEAHKKGLKIIMDVVTNHSSTDHWWMKDMPFKDWVHVHEPYVNTNHVFSLGMDINASKADKKIMEEGWFVPSMPDMNLDNPFMLKYFQQWAIWWIEYSGLDGFRVDTYFYNEKYPMSQWCKAVRDEYPYFNIVGENWNGNPDMVAYWQSGNPNKDGFDSNLPSIMDFPLRDAMNEALRPKEEGRHKSEGGNIFSVYNALSHDFIYHDLSKMLLFLTNHDTPRLGDVVKGNIDKMKLAFTMLATLRGIPQMFYGDEMMFMTGKPGRDDSNLRMDFPGGWKGDRLNLFTQEGREQAKSDTTFARAAELHDYVRTLLRWRRDKDVIHNGKTLHFIPQDNTYAYFRYNDNEVVFVFLNNSDKDAKINWSRYSEISGNLVEGMNVLDGKTVKLSDDTVVAPDSALVVDFKI